MEKLERWAVLAAALVTIIGFPLLFVSSNAGIIHAIQNNKPVLVENGGSYSGVELDKFLGVFDTIALVYRDGFLSDDHLCSSFAYLQRRGQQEL